MQEDHYEGALLEEIKDQNKAILEAVGMMQDNVKKIPAIEESLGKIEQDIKVIKNVFNDANRQLSGHEERLKSIEQAV